MSRGNFFEDFRLGQHFNHALPRTLTDGDAALYIALTGSRNALMSSAPLAEAMGYAQRPFDDLLVFNVAFGKTVSDISLNAIANLGYADVRFLAPAYPGDTISACSTVIGLRETSGGDAGVVHVRSVATNQHGEQILSWIRWVLVNKRDRDAPTPVATVPEHPACVPVQGLSPGPARGDYSAFTRATGSDRSWEDYAPGQRINHASGMTVEEADHMLATRLYQNDARVHFDAHLMQTARHGRRVVYGGHVMSLCRSLAVDGLENVVQILAINGGSHLKPTFAGDTLYAASRVLEKIAIPGRQDVGALRLRLIGLRDRNPSQFTWDGDPADLLSRPDVVLDLDHTVMVPRRHA